MLRAWPINCTRTRRYSYPIARGKIFQSIEILGGVLFVMVATLVATNMKLTKQIGWAFVTLYFVIMAFLILSP